MPTAAAPTIASYVPLLRRLDDEWRLRTVLHEFGMSWLDTPAQTRADLMGDAPVRR